MKHQIDFFDSQDRARQTTLRLVIVYPLIVAAIVVLVYVLVATIGSFFVTGDKKELVDHIWNPQLFAWTAGITLAIIIIGNLYKISQLSSGGPGIALMLGGHLVTPGQCRSSERVVLNVVEEMAIASGTPVPPVFILDAEEGINAFAAGYRPADAVIAISGGAVQYLDRLELQGVVAHEFSHILNGDMRLNMRLVGILHGILMLSYLGEACLRIAYELLQEHGRSHTTEEAQAAALTQVEKWLTAGYLISIPLFFLGGGLQIAGFLGVLFGSWIKSGVSKQREFLADASAVQFTRNPDGIGEALKKIGGLARGSKLRARRTAQFSHMFFSAATEASLIDLFATHPPLEERIGRIDPNWDGAFPDGVAPVGVPVVELKSAEYANKAPKRSSRKPVKQTVALVQPLQTAGLLAGGLVVPTAGPEAALNVEDTLQQVGAPGPEHLAYAAALLAQLSPSLRSAIDEPFGAQAVVLLLLFDEHDDLVREKQLQCLRERFDPGQMKQIESLMPVVREVPVEARLPLVEIAATALRLLSEPQYRNYRELVQKLVDADAKVDYFEFALLRTLERHLAAHFEPKRPPRLKYTAIQPLLPACSMLLSTLAHVGTDDETLAKKAFYEAELVLTSEGGLRLHDRRDTGVRRVDIALEELAQAVPAIKRKVLAACTTCIAYDGKVTIEEAELLRAIADSLDCPLPPLLISKKIEPKI
jgi:Zn-dependent protease with chaperone function